MTQRTLLLSAAYEPMATISWRKAIVMLTLGKVEVVESYDRDIRSTSVVFKLPCVVRLINRFRRYRPQVRYSKQNIFARDRWTCQYCGERRPISQLTQDHVIPRAQGGKTCWENVVISCSRCNLDKGSKPLHRFKRRLLRKPFAPRLDKAAPAHLVSKIAAEIPHQTWSDYIYWNVILEP